MSKAIFESLLKKYSEKEVLILPSSPTPNGSLHVGHIAGPYLRSDLFRRFLEIRGARVKTIIGVDSYDTYIELEASRSEKSEKELVADNVEMIKGELNLSKIAYDEFINPIDYEDRLQKIATTFFQKLLDQKKIAFNSKEVNYWNKKGDRVLTPSIRSTCKVCNNNLSGLICEECGAVFNFYELKNCFYDEEKLIEKEDQFIITTIHKEQLLVTSNSSQPIVRRIVEKFIQDRATLEINLTHPFKWGIELFNSANFKLLTYTNRYVYYYLLGDIYSELANNSINPYERASKVEIISIYGKDNIVSNCVIKGGMLHKLDLRQETGCISNDYYLLNGEKFSTSRNNKISVSEVLQSYEINEIRYYLSLTSPSNKSASFSRNELRFVCENEIHPLMKTIQDFSKTIVTEKTNQEHAVGGTLYEAFFSTFLSQETTFSAKNFVPDEFLIDFRNWSRLSQGLANRSEIRFWLKATLLFLYPIMPDYTEDTWNMTFDEEFSFHSITER